MNPKTAALLRRAALFRCPLCHTSFTAEGASLICAAGHTFDVSRKGTVNFVPAQKPMKYTEELFQARGRILAAGYYDGLLEELRRLIDAHRGPDRPLALVDAGCGQGFYSKALADGRDSVLGFDLSAEAIHLAAGGSHLAQFFVGDLTNIPLTDGSQDIILDILTQAHYGEFQRILKADGLLIKVIPGAEYLQEIRHLLDGQLQARSDREESVTEHFARHFALRETVEVRRTLPLDPALARDFLEMTPLTFHIDTDSLPVHELQTITIHLKLLVGTPN